MSLLKVEWSFHGDFDSFDVIRSNAPMDINNLPSPIVTGLSRMVYNDISIINMSTYYYRIRAWYNGKSQISDEIEVLAQPVMGSPYDLYAIFDNGNFGIPTNMNARSLL